MTYVGSDITMTTVGNVSFNVTAYNLAVDYALRPELPFDAVADVSPQNVDHPGTTITFRMMTEMAAATSTLGEDDDVSPVDLASTTVTLTLNEYGNAVKMSAVLSGTGYILPFDPIAAELIGYNAALSIDTLARTALEGGTQFKRSTVAGENNDNLIGTGDTFTGAIARYMRNRLKSGNVRTNSGRFYTGYIHPDIAYDFQQDTGTGNWLAVYQGSGDLDPLKEASIGQFAGINWIETTRCGITADAGNGSGGAGNIDVYNTTVCGRQALSKGYAVAKSGPMPKLVPTPVIDTLQRFSGIGWYWFGGYGRYREEAIYRYRNASSIGANS